MKNREITTSIKEKVGRIVESDLLMAYEVKNNIFSGNIVFSSLNDSLSIDCKMVFKINDQRYKRNIKLSKCCLMSLKIKEHVIEMFYTEVIKILTSIVLNNNVSEIKKILF